MRYVAIEIQGKESPNTTRNRLQSLAWLYRWGQQLHGESWDPESRLLEPVLMDREQISSLSNFLRLKEHQPKMVEFDATTGGGAVGVLGGDTVKSYLEYIRDFTKWAAETQSTPRAPDSAVASLVRAFDAEIDALASTKAAPPRSINPEEQAELVSVCHPEYANNPFNRQVRHRNYAIVYTLLTTGIRRGELLKVRLEDLCLDRQNPSLSIVLQDEKSASERFDNRLQKPRQKTKARKIPLTEQARDAIVAYLRKERSSNARSPFLFLSSRGKDRAMAETAVNNIFNQINRRFPDEFSRMRPHLLRHTFNHNFKLHNLAANMKGEQLRQVQNYLGGWSDRSEQSSLYGADANSRIAEEYIRGMHDSLEKRVRLSL